MCAICPPSESQTGRRLSVSDPTTSLASFDGITATATTQHEKLSATYKAPTDGVMYIYVANENSETGDVWFDDLLVIHEKTTSSLNACPSHPWFVSSRNNSRKAENQY